VLALLDTGKSTGERQRPARTGRRPRM